MPARIFSVSSPLKLRRRLPALFLAWTLLAPCALAQRAGDASRGRHFPPAGVTVWSE